MGQIGERPTVQVPQGMSPCAEAAANANAAAMTATDEWARAFEDFFGRDCAGRLRQGDDSEREVSRMINQIYEYMKKQNLQKTNDVLSLDDTLIRIFRPVMTGGQTTSYRLRDLLLLMRQVISVYKSRAGQARVP